MPASTALMLFFILDDSCGNLSGRSRSIYSENEIVAARDAFIKIQTSLLDFMFNCGGQLFLEPNENYLEVRLEVRLARLMRETYLQKSGDSGRADEILVWQKIQMRLLLFEVI